MYFFCFFATSKFLAIFYCRWDNDKQTVIRLILLIKMDYCLSESNNNYVHAKFVCPFFQHGRSAVTLLWRTFWLSPVEQRETRYWLDKYSRATATLSITYCCESWALVPHLKQLHKTSASRDRPSLTRVTACSYRSQCSWVHIWWVHCYWSLPLSEDDRALCGGRGDPLKSHEILQMTAKQSALKLRADRYYIFTRPSATTWPVHARRRTLSLPVLCGDLHGLSKLGWRITSTCAGCADVNCLCAAQHSGGRSVHARLHTLLLSSPNKKKKKKEKTNSIFYFSVVLIPDKLYKLGIYFLFCL